LTRADQVVARAATARDAADENVREAATALAEAVDALNSADEAVHAAQHAEMATTLRRTLVAGEPCPVCAQPVKTKPRAGAAAGSRGAERARASAATRHDRATKTLARATAAGAQAAAQATSAQADRERATAALEAAGAAERTAEAA